MLLLRGHVKLLLLFKPKKNIWPQVDVIFYKFRVMGRHQNQQNLRDMAPLNALFKTYIYQKQSPFDHGYIVLYSMTSIINYYYYYYYYYTILLFLCTTAYSQNRWKRHIFMLSCGIYSGNLPLQGHDLCDLPLRANWCRFFSQTEASVHFSHQS